MPRLPRFKRSTPPSPAAPRVLPDGQRVYAIGDIHGRSDLLDRLMSAIDTDDRERGATHTTCVFLGDLTDRGPDSRGVIERAIRYASQNSCIFVMGNHEEVLINAWEGDLAAARLFHRIGGRATLLSYGIDAATYDAADFEQLARLIADTVPAEHIAFLRRFRDSWRCGDYLFVHAGVRPGVGIEQQSAEDMRWIRARFLDDGRDHGALVIHGHSIEAEVAERANRIGIDTGAYGSGVLTAIGIEGSERWYLSS